MGLAAREVGDHGDDLVTLVTLPTARFALLAAVPLRGRQVRTNP